MIKSILTFGLLAISIYFINNINYTNKNIKIDKNLYKNPLFKNLKIRTLLNDKNLENDFTLFSQKYQKNYLTLNNRNYRKLIFYTNLKFITEYNKNNSDTKLGINSFADKLIDEFENTHLKNKNKLLKSIKVDLKIEKEIKKFFDIKKNVKIENLKLPEILSFIKNKNIMKKSSIEEKKLGKIRNQGECGSCYAHSALSIVETLLANKNKIENPESLSVQEIVDCDKENSGCDGGLIEDVFKYIKNNGIRKEKDYPYVDKEQKCNKTIIKEKKSEVNLKYDYKKVPNGLLSLIYHVNKFGNVGVSVRTGSVFSFAKDGIWNFRNMCGIVRNHAINVVGYDLTTPNEEYLLIRNSWGTDWGKDGYLKLKILNFNPNGQCNLGYDLYITEI